MNKEEISEEELQIILEHRRVKKEALEQVEETTEEKEDEEFSDLEKKFIKAVEKANTEVAKCLVKADKEIQKALDIAQKYGVPIEVDLTCMPMARWYRPESESAKWADIDLCNVYDEMQIYISNDSGEAGWEYWSTSSLTC